MSILDKAKRYGMKWVVWEFREDWEIGELPDGQYIHADDPVLAAMKEVCEAALDWAENDWCENFHDDCPAKLTDAIASLRALTEKTDD